MIAAAAAASTLALAPGQASAFMLTIDDFSSAQRVTSAAVAPSVSASQVFEPNAIGMWRDMRVETDGPGEANTTLEVAGGFLSFSNNATVTGRGWITYDGANDATANGVQTDGLGGVNFLIGPDPYLEFQVVSFEADLDVLITVWDMDGSVSTYFETLPPAGQFNPLLPLSDFVLASGPSFDWTRVGAIEFFIESQVVGYDGVIDGIVLNAVPLPAPALLLLGGLGGIGGMTLLRNRRRKA